MDGVNPKINVSLWLCNMKKITIILKIKRRSKAQREDKLQNLKGHIPWVSF